MYYQKETYKEIAPGIFLIGRYGVLKTGIWILVDKDEAVIVEMPDLLPDKSDNPMGSIKDFLRSNKLNLRFITATHSHKDHFLSTGLFYRTFPNIPIVVHESFLFDSIPYRKFDYYVTACSLKRKTSRPTLTANLITPYNKNSFPLYLFKGIIFSYKLGREPLFLIHAPKHSSSDIMIIFRGTMISGDWWIGENDPNWNRVPKKIVDNSINTLIGFSRKHKYMINRIFSSHADNFLHNVDFFNLMERSRNS